MISKEMLQAALFTFMWAQALYHGAKMARIFIIGIRTKQIQWNSYSDSSDIRRLSQEEAPRQFDCLLFRAFSSAVTIYSSLILSIFLHWTLLKSLEFLIFAGGGLFLFSNGINMLIAKGGFHQIWPSDSRIIRDGWITSEHAKFKDILYGLYLGMGLLFLLLSLAIV